MSRVLTFLLNLKSHPPLYLTTPSVMVIFVSSVMSAVKMQKYTLSVNAKARCHWLKIYVLFTLLKKFALRILLSHFCLFTVVKVGLESATAH